MVNHTLVQPTEMLEFGQGFLAMYILDMGGMMN